MELKELNELNDTLIAHQIIDLAKILQKDETNSRVRAEPNKIHDRKPLTAFIPGASKRYGEIREAIKAALAEK